MLERDMQFSNTEESAIVVIADENVTDVRFLQFAKDLLGSIVIELLEKSILPERFAQASNAVLPRELNDIGAKVSNPVIVAEGI